MIPQKRFFMFFDMDFSCQDGQREALGYLDMNA